MQITLNIDKSKKYLLACSFGPDSMALFKMLLDSKINFEVAHVNYHKRMESNNEEIALKEYCSKNNILCFVLDATKYTCKGNFQAWARDLRYTFFEDLCNDHKLAGVFVAHQEDDLIENFIIQSQRKAYVKSYGISEISKYRGITIFRPLLKFTKKELQDFDDVNKIPYSIDVSNLSNDYTRNKIRHTIIEKLSKEERCEYINKISKLNNELHQTNKEALKLIDENDSILVSNAIKANDNVYALAVFELLNRINVSLPISNKEISTFKKMMLSKKANITYALSEDITYVQEYGYIKIVRKLPEYKLVLEKPSAVKNDILEVDFSMGAEDRNVNDDSYPISIEPACRKDRYKINDYYVSVSRLYLNWKMPAHLRPIWPVIRDSSGNIIYIPRYRKDFTDNHKSLMKINLK